MSFTPQDVYQLQQILIANHKSELDPHNQYGQATQVVPTSRLVQTGTGLSGGGDLTSDRTIALANTTVTAGVYGDSTHTVTLTVDAQGRITAAAVNAIPATPPGGSSGQLQYDNGGAFGGVAASTIASSGVLLTLSAQAVADRPLALKAFAGQTGSLLELQDSTGTAIAAIDKGGAFKPPHLADASAANDTVYFSTTSSKLVYKDAGGTVNPLY